MKFQGLMIVVKDMQKSLNFYKEVLQQEVILDFGANKTLTGDFSLQEYEYWQKLCLKKGEEIAFGGNNFELYFEEDDFDGFIKKLENIQDIEYVHKTNETPWGQRTVKFYDPDKHMIEVSENMDCVCKRFFDGGMSIAQVAQRMDVPQEFVKESLDRCGCR